MLKDTKFPRTILSVTILFTVICFIIYSPVLGNDFLSDDYDSLYRIYIQKRILYREFLRPMIDLSFYFNYILSGLSPWSYYVFNISVHIINALLIFRFLSGFVLFSKRDQYLFACVGSFLFLVYPFHNESVVWLSGRLSSMACLFAMISLIIANEKSGIKSVFVSGIFYLIGLLCYESIIFLPVIILIITWLKEKSFKKLIIPGFFWLLATGFYLVARFILSGEITGNYGDRLSDHNIKLKILNAGKIFGRLFLPGSESTHLLLWSTLIVFLFVLIILRIIWTDKSKKRDVKLHYAALLASLLVSLIIPVAFGVSTRTSEGDRLLYFPSCFLCMLIAGAIIWISERKAVRLITILSISAYFICFLEINNHQWVKASVAARTILNSIRNKGRENIVLINIPDELEGAFVFRNGFMKALMVHKMDTAGINIMNFLKRSDYLKTGELIPVLVKDSTMTIYPDTRIVNHMNGFLQLTNSQNNSSLYIRKDRNLIYYWNKAELIRLF